MSYISDARSYKANARGKYYGMGAAVLIMFGPATNGDFKESIAVSWDYQENIKLEELLEKYNKLNILAGFDRVNRKVIKVLEKLRNKAERKIKLPEKIKGFTTIQ